MFARRPSLRLMTVMTLPLLAACQKEQVQTYRIPKEAGDQHSAQASGPGMASGSNQANPPGTAFGSDSGGGAPAAFSSGLPASGSMNGSVPTASGPALTWTAPSDWHPAAANAMEKAKYILSAAGAQAELAVTAFPGDVGGELANVNRWRGQAGLPPIDASALNTAVTHVSASGLNITVIDADGPTTHLLGAIVPFADSTWFFKMTGPSAAVASRKGQFLDFLESVSGGGAPAASSSGTPVPGTLSNSLPTASAPDAMSGPVPIAGGPGLIWSVPAGWTEFPPGEMAKANYHISGPDGQGALGVYAFPGDVGGELANVNRWRGQAGLPPVDDTTLPTAVTRLSASGLNITVVDAEGPAGHMLAAIVPLGDSTWFFKLTGPAPLVASQKAAFLDFLRTVKPAANST